MFGRFCFSGLLLICLVVFVTGCEAPASLTSIVVTPTGTNMVAGATVQLTATGTYSHGNHPAQTQDITNQVTWTTTSIDVAKVSTTGLVTGQGAGTVQITASAQGFTGLISGSTNVTVTAGTSTATASVSLLTIFPSTQTATALSQQTQFSVLGTLATTGLQYDVTNSTQIVWSSSDNSVVTIGTNGNGTPGLALAAGAGTATIIATYSNPDGSVVKGTASYTATLGPAQEPLLSINVVPGGTTVSNEGMTGQYLAFGAFTCTPTVRDITNGYTYAQDSNCNPTTTLTFYPTTWLSLLPELASINSGGITGEIAGLATAEGYTGNTVIYAESVNPDGTVVLSNSQTFTCKDVTGICEDYVATPQFATVTVYIAGGDASLGYVTAPSDTGTANLIHCGAGWTPSAAQVCAGTYEVGSTVTLTETGGSFGGWSSGTGLASGGNQVGCTPATGNTPPYPSTCTITLSGDTTVGAIFY